MAKKQKMNAFLEEEKTEAAGAVGDKDGAMPDHADAEQDKALFAQLIKQYLGKESPDEMECEMAKQAYEAHKESGMSHEDAMEAAGKHLKMAAHIGHKMHQAMEKKKSECGDKEHEKHEDMSSESHHKEDMEKEEKKESEQPSPAQLSPGKKESDKVVEMTAEVAKLRENLKTYELRDYLDSKMKKSGESNTCTKLFREALGTARSKQHIDETWNTFIKAYKAGAEEVGSDDVFFMEKQNRSTSGEKNGSFADCLDTE